MSDEARAPYGLESHSKAGARGLPGIEETTSWGAPALKAHGKLWVWWSPHEDAPVFKVPIDEREMLIEAEPEPFFFTPHYKDHPMVLVRPERLDLKWVKANLIRVWRAQAPKRVLRTHDDGHVGSVTVEQTTGRQSRSPRRLRKQRM